MEHDSNAGTANAPNHHADHPGFSGITGRIAAATMRFGRDDTAELAITLTAPAPGERLVDIGCGPGVAALRAASRGATVTGVDPADVMLRAARKDDPGGSVTWLQGTAEALPVADGSCNVAWSLSTVHHWPDLDRALAEVRRVLTADGRFLAIERRVKSGATGLASHGWTDLQADAFAGLCDAAGFEGIEVSTHDTSRGAQFAVIAYAR
jgi:ubiquinone/menaquinone biosynthesis C-methylase UbiE